MVNMLVSGELIDKVFNHFDNLSAPFKEKSQEVWGQVLINGAVKDIGMTDVLAVPKSRGMKVARAVDSYLLGEDIRK
nr:dihydrodipicolinate reductase-like protein CRR1, chloroplastic [Tanacetum cinerariifolium]